MLAKNRENREESRLLDIIIIIRKSLLIREVRMRTSKIISNENKL